MLSCLNTENVYIHFLLNLNTGQQATGVAKIGHYGLHVPQLGSRPIIVKESERRLKCSSAEKQCGSICKKK